MDISFGVKEGRPAIRLATNVTAQVRVHRHIG